MTRKAKVVVLGEGKRKERMKGMIDGVRLRVTKKCRKFNMKRKNVKRRRPIRSKKLRKMLASEVKKLQTGRVNERKFGPGVRRRSESVKSKKRPEATSQKGPKSHKSRSSRGQAVKRGRVMKRKATRKTPKKVVQKINEWRSESKAEEERGRIVSDAVQARRETSRNMRKCTVRQPSCSSLVAKSINRSLLSSSSTLLLSGQSGVDLNADSFLSSQLLCFVRGRPFQFSVMSVVAPDGTGSVPEDEDGDRTRKCGSFFWKAKRAIKAVRPPPSSYFPMFAAPLDDVTAAAPSIGPSDGTTAFENGEETSLSSRSSTAVRADDTIGSSSALF